MVIIDEHTAAAAAHHLPSSSITTECIDPHNHYLKQINIDL
jgi:hypothetical protein